MKSDYTIIRNLPQPVLVIDRQLQILEVSQAALTLFNLGYFPENITRNRQCFADWLLKQHELRDMLAAVITRVTPSATLGSKLSWQDGTRFFHVSVTPIAPHVADIFFLSFVDYTEHLAIERANAQVRGYLESIMSSLYLGIIVVNRDLQITNMNRTQELFLQQLGHPVPLVQAVGMHLDELFPEEGALLDKIRNEVLEKGLVCGGITEHEAANDNTEKIFSVSFFPLRGERNDIVGIIRVCEDVTEQTRMEGELRAVETRTLEVETIRKVIITLNHEINNALMVVVGNAEVLLRGQPPLLKEQQTMLNSILEQAEKITEVTQQLGRMQTVRTDAYLKNGPEMIVAN